MLGAAEPTPRASPPPLPPCALRGLCAWLDGLPLSRPKRHLARDFSDGVMLAEIVKHFRPRLVDLHNYVPTCNTDQKLSNWSILNRKVFHKLRLWVSETDIRKVVANTPGAIEPILCALREKVTDGAAHQYLLDPAGPGPSGGIADRPQAELTASLHTGSIPHPQIWRTEAHQSLPRRAASEMSSHSGRAGASLLPTPPRLQLPKGGPQACLHPTQVPCRSGTSRLHLAELGQTVPAWCPLGLSALPPPHVLPWGRIFWGKGGGPQINICLPLRLAGPRGTLQCEDPTESEDSRENRPLCVHGLGPSWWTLGAPGLQSTATTGGKGAGTGPPAGDGQDFADEGGQAGAPGKAEGPADWRADESRGRAPVTKSGSGERLLREARGATPPKSTKPWT